jgi:hypothetical protein
MAPLSHLGPTDTVKGHASNRKHRELKRKRAVPDSSDESYVEEDEYEHANSETDERSYSTRASSKRSAAHQKVSKAGDKFKEIDGQVESCHVPIIFFSTYTM